MHDKPITSRPSNYEVRVMRTFQLAAADEEEGQALVETLIGLSLFLFILTSFSHLLTQQHLLGGKIVKRFKTLQTQSDSVFAIEKYAGRTPALPRRVSISSMTTDLDFYCSQTTENLGGLIAGECGDQDIRAQYFREGS
jgi:hypothetical protein